MLGVRYMDSTENLRNGYLDPKDSHRSAGRRMLLEMVRMLPVSSELYHVQHSLTVLCRIFNWSIKVCSPSLPPSLPASSFFLPTLPTLSRCLLTWCMCGLVKFPTKRGTDWCHINMKQFWFGQCPLDLALILVKTPLISPFLSSLPPCLRHSPTHLRVCLSSCQL